MRFSLVERVFSNLPFNVSLLYFISITFCHSKNDDIYVIQQVFLWEYTDEEELFSIFSSLDEKLFKLPHCIPTVNLNGMILWNEKRNMCCGLTR